MADKTKITKKTAKEDAEFAKLPLDQQLVKKQAELLTARKSLYDGTLTNPHAIKALRKEIARISTKINQEKGV